MSDQDVRVTVEVKEMGALRFNRVSNLEQMGDFIQVFHEGGRKCDMFPIKDVKRVKIDGRL